MTAVTGNGTAMRGLGGAAGFGETLIARGDDTATQVDLTAVFANTIPFAPGVSANHVFLHTDGYLTFGAASIGMPADPASLTTAFIAPFMADIDTRLDGEGTESGPIWLDIDAVNDIVTFTWENVGFYRRNADRTNTFQLQLYQQDDGTVDIVFRYERIDWTSGDLQGGAAGIGGLPAFAGYRFSPNGAIISLPAARNEAGLLALESGAGNTGQTGMWHYRFGGEVYEEGGPGNDTLTGGSEADSLSGGAGNDVIFGLGGGDSLNGGSGYDWLDYSASTLGVDVNIGTNAATGGHATGDVISAFEALRGSAFNDTLTGSAYSDALDGIDGNDMLSGLGGADTLTGGAGDDTLDGGGGGDILTAGAGRDRVSYASAGAGVTVDLGQPGQSSGDAAGDILAEIEEVQGSALGDTLIGAAGNDYFLADAGNDSLSGGAGADSLFGGLGNDTLRGGLGVDLLDGGAGTDMVSYWDATEALTIDIATPANNTGQALGDIWSQIEWIEGSGFDDQIRGNGAANGLFGGDGRDQLFGGAGNDSLEGGGGNDSITGGAGADTIDGGAGIDRVSYLVSGLAVSINLETGVNSGGDAAGDVLNRFEIIEGSAYGDTLIGSGGSETLLGDDGHDRLDAAAGPDHLFGGNGNDTLVGGGGADTLDGGAGSDIVSYNAATAGFRLNLSQPSQTTGDPLGDVLTDIEGIEGGNFDDTITGDAGHNLLWGRVGTDLLTGDGGNDLLDGGAGNDTLLGSAGNDSLWGGDGTDLILGDDSSDLVKDAAFFYFVQGLYPPGTGSDAGAAVLGHDDFLFAGSGADRLFGGQGNDALDGGDGNDRLHGGAGADRFTHLGTATDGTDVVLDYDPGQADVLVFSANPSVRADFSLTRTPLPGYGVHAIGELQITHLPSGRLIWTLQDGAGLTSVMIEAGSTAFDLLA